MSSNHPPIHRMVEMSLIKQDLCLYFELIAKLSKRKMAGILFPSLVPYLSLFVVEAHNYLHNRITDYDHSLTNELKSIITASRMRVKLFDDTKKEVDGTLELLSWIKDFHEEWHIGRHKGFWAPLQKAIQDDFGVFFYESHIMGSTHTGILNLGYSKGDLPDSSDEISEHIKKLSFSVAKGLGTYISKVISLPQFSPSESDFGYVSYNINDDLLKFKDEKSNAFLTRVFNGSAPREINLSLIIFLSHLNYINYILTGIVQKDHYTIFKLQYILLYHLTSSLKKMKDHPQYGKLLTARSVKYIESIVSDSALEELVSKRPFRNILIHYGIGDKFDPFLSMDIPLYGLAEHFFSGKSYQQVQISTFSQINRISIIMEEWLDWQLDQELLQKW